MLLTPNIALAAETFTYDGYNYSIEKVKLKRDLDIINEGMFGVDKNGNYIFRDWKTNTFYKVNEKECLEMSIEEIIEVTNTPADKFLVIYGENEKHYIYEFQPLYYTIPGLIKTPDTELDPNKDYHDENGNWIEEPVESDIDSYYDWCEFRYPTSAEIDDSGNTIYYTKKENTEVFEEEKNPIQEEIDKYFLKVEEEPLVKKEIKKLDKTIFEPILSDCNFMDVYMDEETQEIRIITRKDNIIKIYADDGTVIKEKEYDNIFEMSKYSNSLFGIIDEDMVLKILDKDLNIVFKSELNMMLHEIQYKDNVHILFREIHDGNGHPQSWEFYTMKRTKIVDDENNQESNNPTNTPTNKPTDSDANKNEKDETPKMGSNTIDNTFLFIGLIVISLVGILNTKKYKK